MPSDAELLKQYVRSGDSDAFAELVRRHAGLVYGACLRATGNSHDAEDAAQESFLEMARGAEAVRSALPAWLHATALSRARNLVRSASRRRHREERVMSQETAQTEPTWAELAPRVDDAVAELPEEVRVPVILHFLEGKSQTEIAQELDINQSTVSRRIEKGLSELREKLRQAGVV